jgi:hypothetical protein
MCAQAWAHTWACTDMCGHIWTQTKHLSKVLSAKCLTFMLLSPLHYGHTVQYSAFASLGAHDKNELDWLQYDAAVVRTGDVC